MDLPRTLSNRSVAPDVPQQQPFEDDEIDLGALFATLWRGKWIIALFAIIAVLIGGYYAFVAATPLYRATSVLILETQQDQIVDLQSVAGGLTGDSSEINSELEVLKSRGLIGKVVDRLDLTTDPEFNSALREPTMRAQTIGLVRQQISDLIGREAEPLQDLSPEALERQTRDRVISTLLDQVSVSNVRQSFVISVTVETENPRKSAEIADTLAELYILDQIDVKFRATEQATIWLSGRVTELQQTLEQAEAEVSAFSAGTDLVSVEALRALERQIKELRDRIDAAVSDRAELSARTTALQSVEDRAGRAALANDTQLDRLLSRAEDDANIAAAFDARFDTVVQRAQLDLARADQQIAALRTSEMELEQEISEQSEDLITLQQLTREAEAARVLYEYFLNRLNETAAQQGIQQADSRMLSNAVIPNAPSEPRKSRVVALSFILGIMLGAGLILLREMRNQSFRTARDLEAATGYTVLGQIPVVPARSRRKILKYFIDKPTSAAAEAVRNLRTSLMLSNVDRPPQVIVSTSSIPGEGKTTNSIALAHNLLGMGKSVLLIEGDIRRQTLSHYFDEKPGAGLVSVLAGEATLDTAVHKPSALGVDVLGGETSNTNAADLFASDKFKDLVTQARQTYDVVIIDTPPVLVVPDARIIAEQADAVIFSVYWDKTSKQQVEEALRLFHNSGQRISGLVLSQISPSGMKKYGYGGRYGAYAGYGSKYYAG